MRAREIGQAWFDMCRLGDVGRFAELATHDFLCHGPGGTGDRETFIDWLRWDPSAFADQRASIEDVIAEGDRVVIRYTVRSTYRGGYLDLPNRGQHVEETGIIIYRLEGDRVAETWFESNDLEVAQQLGGRVHAPEH
jgi:predicted ester cyclase